MADHAIVSIIGRPDVGFLGRSRAEPAVTSVVTIVGTTGTATVSVGDAASTVGVHEGAVDMIVGRGRTRSAPGHVFGCRLVTGVTGDRIDTEEGSGIHMFDVRLAASISGQIDIVGIVAHGTGSGVA